MSPTTRLVAILMLAATIAASTAASAVVQAAIRTSLGVPEPGGLLNIEPLRDLPGRGAVVFNESWPNYQRLQARAYEPFAAVTCALQSVIGWDDRGEVRPLQASRVTASFFATVAAPLAAGQPFTEVHDGPVPAPVVVISHRLWHQAFGGEPTAIGQSIRLAGTPHTVLGVMPAHFGIPAPTDVWLPLGHPTYIAPTGRVFSVFARVKPGFPDGQVAAAMEDFTARTLEADSVVNRDYRYRARPLREALAGTSAPVIWLLQAGALLLFVLAVSNVWALMLAAVIERGHETAVRRALGASAVDIARLLTRRSLEVAIPAGILGAALAWLVLPLVRQLRPTPALAFLLAGARIDAAVLFIAIALTMAAALVIALVPAWHASRQPAMTALGSMSRGSTLSRSSSRWLRSLVAGQSALTVVVLFAAAISGASFWRISGVVDGFDTADRTIARVMLPETRYPNHAARAEFARRLTDAAAGAREVETFAFTTTLPVGDQLWGGRFFPEMPDGSTPTEPITLHYRRVSPGYLEAMGIPLLRGRHLTLQDDIKAPHVAIISRAAAERLFAGRDPIGRTLRRFVPTGTPAQPIEVIGVAGDTLDAGYAAPVGEAIYVPFAQQSVSRLSLVVKPRGDAAAAITAVRRAVREVDETIALSDIAPLEEIVADARIIPRLQMVLLALFAVMAVGLTALGTYGVMSQLVTSRQRELAVRLAVGATPRRIGGMVVIQNARLALFGIAAGLIASWQAGKLLAPVVFGVSSTSPTALAIVGGATLLVTSAATLLPAARAAGIDVTRRLRT